MRLFLVALLWVAPVLAQNCDYTVSPSPTLTISSGASTGTISVTTSSTCSWAVVNNDPNLYWLKFDVMQGTGSGAVHYTATANPTALVRGGNIQVAGKTIGVSQGATDCTYTLDSTSQNFPTDGGAGTLKLTTGCVWQPSSANANMITIPTSGTIRTGTGTVDYTVSHNTCVYGRNSSIRFSTTSPASVVPVFSVNQDGSQSNLTLSAMSVSLGPEASDGRVSVTTGFGCTWSAFSSETWIQLINASGSGNGAITYHVQANNTAPRTGTIHVGGLNYTITQSSSGPPAPAISSVTSAANYRADAASPGEIVTIFGSNMGPATLTTLQLSGGNVSSFLAGTQVLFDGVPAPIIYTRNNQVSAVAPYGVAGKTNTQVQVVYNGQTSTGVSVPVQSSHPAIFTMDSSGLGPGAILNQDYSINSSTNAAARGSVILIYCTGGGVTNPALTDGALVGTDLPQLTQPVSVTIGGISARVAYAGGVPGQVVGFVQINAEVPAGVPVGVQSVVIKVGDYSSTSGVTVTVK